MSTVPADILESIIIQHRNTRRMVTVSGVAAHCFCTNGEFDRDKLINAIKQVGALGALAGDDGNKYYQIDFIWD